MEELSELISSEDLTTTLVCILLERESSQLFSFFQGNLDLLASMQITMTRSENSVIL